MNIVEEKNNKRICKVIVYIPFGTDSIGIREALLRVHGPSTEIKFVQGIIANDIERASKCIIDCNSKDTYVYFPGCKVCEQQILKLSELGNNFGVYCWSPSNKIDDPYKIEFIYENCTITKRLIEVYPYENNLRCTFPSNGAIKKAS